MQMWEEKATLSQIQMKTSENKSGTTRRFRGEGSERGWGSNGDEEATSEGEEKGASEGEAASESEEETSRVRRRRRWRRIKCKSKRKVIPKS